MTEFDHDKIAKAVQERRPYIAKRRASVTLKEIRAVLEGDLKVPRKSLRPYNKVIEALVSEILQELAAAEEAENQTSEPSLGKEDISQKGKKRRQDKAVEQLTKKPKNEREQPSKKPQKEKNPLITAPRKEGRQPTKLTATKNTKRLKEATNPAEEEDEDDKHAELLCRIRDLSASECEKRVAKYKDACQQVGIRAGGACVSRSKDIHEKTVAYIELLEKHGLGEHFSEKDIKQTKKDLDKAKELEGINTSNIIQGGRRPRTAVDYSAILKPKYEEIDEEEEFEEEEEEEEESSGVEEVFSDEDSDAENMRPKNGAGEKRTGRRRQEMESDVEEEENASRDTDEAADSEAEGSGGGAQEGNDAKSAPRSGCKKEHVGTDTSTSVQKKHQTNAGAPERQGSGVDDPEDEA